MPRGADRRRYSPANRPPDSDARAKRYPAGGSAGVTSAKNEKLTTSYAATLVDLPTSTTVVPVKAIPVDALAALLALTATATAPHGSACVTGRKVVVVVVVVVVDCETRTTPVIQGCAVSANSKLPGCKNCTAYVPASVAAPEESSGPCTSCGSVPSHVHRTTSPAATSTTTLNDDGPHATGCTVAPCGTADVTFLTASVADTDPTTPRKMVDV
mmetsp:Transcript_30617/g.80155  ORF Transcript_30617/g.80155 Transcript_30617/m.80155 type:complete len:214 (+) Transcript_30617:222-863(+)